MALETLRLNPIETDLESWARAAIKKAGGLMLKWTSPGQRGVPDNIIFWRGRWVHFAEFKILDRQPDEQQKDIHALLHSFGHRVFIPRCQADIERYIETWSQKK